MIRLSDNPDLIIMGESLLFKEQPEVNPEDILLEDFQHNLRILKKKQISSHGIGIAAPQVGWGARVMCIGIDADADTKSRYPQIPDIPFSFWINPIIKKYSSETCWAWEGCLSVPGMRGWIERPCAINVHGLNDKMELVEAYLDGFSARVILHELDHIDGKLFPDRVDDASLLLSNASFEKQAHWPENWPTANARATAPGAISINR